MTDPIIRIVDEQLTRTTDRLENMAYSVRAHVLGHRLEAVAESEGGPEARGASTPTTVSASAHSEGSSSEAPSPSDINDLTADLSTIHDELRDLYTTPPLVSRSRRYERVAILHEQAGRAARGLAAAWDEYERSKA